jgi:transposase
MGDKPAKAQISLQKQFCVTCKHTWWPKMSFANGKEQMTISFKNHALALLKFGTIKDVNLHLGVGWDTIKAIHKNHLQDRYQEIDMSDVEYISIDEFSIAKGHRYMTIFMEIKTGRIIEAIEGRKVEDISSALENLKKKHRNLKVLQLT